MKTKRAHSRRTPASSQRGVVLLFSLIALVILLIAAVGLVRSFKTSLFTSANIAFKRDLQNQGERAIDKVLVAFRPAGALASPLSRSVSNPAQHYSAVALPSNELGIPNALQTDALYAAVADGSKDISAANDSSLAGMAVRIQYVVDRLSVHLSLFERVSCISLLLNEFRMEPLLFAKLKQNLFFLQEFLVLICSERVLSDHPKILPF